MNALKWWQRFGEPKDPLVEKLFIRCLNTGNRNLAFRFIDKYYIQKQGLAMGVADSPDLANLWGAKFEQELAHLDLLFYGRYINDCFAVVLADSERAAFDFIKSKVQFDELNIEWSSSPHNVVFLDLFIYLEPGATALAYKPYRKAMNHQERIPWISMHPLDVKRGTYLGEMSCLAMLSSSTKHYLDAIAELKVLYVACGYPEALV